MAKHWYVSGEFQNIEMLYKTNHYLERIIQQANGMTMHEREGNFNEDKLQVPYISEYTAHSKLRHAKSGKRNIQIKALQNIKYTESENTVF